MAGLKDANVDITRHQALCQCRMCWVVEETLGYWVKTLACSAARSIALAAASVIGRYRVQHCLAPLGSVHPPEVVAVVLSGTGPRTAPAPVLASFPECALWSGHRLTACAHHVAVQVEAAVVAAGWRGCRSADKGGLQAERSSLEGTCFGPAATCSHP